MDEISITIAFVLLGLTWLTLRGMDGREKRRHRRYATISSIHANSTKRR